MVYVMIPESQMTGDEAQHESGKQRRGRDRQVGRQTEETQEKQEMKEV